MNLKITVQVRSGSIATSARPNRFGRSSKAHPGVAEVWVYKVHKWVALDPHPDSHHSRRACMEETCGQRPGGIYKDRKRKLQKPDQEGSQT